MQLELRGWSNHKHREKNTREERDMYRDAAREAHALCKGPSTTGAGFIHSTPNVH